MSSEPDHCELGTLLVNIMLQEWSTLLYLVNRDANAVADWFIDTLLHEVIEELKAMSMLGLEGN